MNSQDEPFFTFEVNAPKKLNLGNLEDVDALVRLFVSDAIANYSAFHQGVQTREEALGSLEEDARALGLAFMGEDPDYVTTEWHASNRLGAHIRAQSAIGFKDTQHPGEAFFRWLGVQCINACNDLYNGTEAGQVRNQLEVTLKGAIHFLMVGEG